MFTLLLVVFVCWISQRIAVYKGALAQFYLIRSVELTFNLLDKFQVSSYGYRNPHQDVTPISPNKPEHLIMTSDIYYSPYQSSRF